VLRIGQIPYLNCEPFFARLGGGFELVPLHPRRLGQAVAAGELDAGALSLMDFLRLQPGLEPLPFGIATDGAAQSVFVFSHRPLRDLDGAVIGVTGETSTSVELLRVLLALKYQVTPRAWVTPDDPCDAVLLIGDAAIRALTGGAGYPCVADLGTEWVEWTGLPFVFARWGVSTRVPAPERRALRTELDRALDAGLAALPEIGRARRDTGWSPAQVEAYLRGFNYRLGHNEERAIAEFVRRHASLPGERHDVAGLGSGHPGRA
jgi:chorismate dehydratase